MDNLIITKENQGVFTITLNRFSKKNALNNSMYRQLCQHLNYANETDSIHCVLIQGDESCFCAGNDLQDFIESSTDDELIAVTLINTLVHFNKPLVAAVAGPAVGIGTTLLLHCDMVIAADNSKFKLPFTQLGLCPEAGSSLLITQLVGHRKAFELMVLGQSFNAKQASQYGIVNQVCASDELLALAEKTALTIARLPHDAVLTSKKLLRQADKAILQQVIVNEVNDFSRLVNSDECKTILSQFFK
ncbi:MAG: enoyl-CoA hydratase-related protein [Colwellia sp.]|nr:enoyl-CoA hydratase-related protein [Colwellia sp.]